MRRKPIFPRIIIVLLVVWQISCVVGIKKAPAQSNNRLLGVVVMVNGNTIKLKGYCIYVKDGKEIRKELEKDNAWAWNFRGDYIKEVKMQKVSGDASYRLFVMEGQDSESGQPVFESESISSTEPIIYVKK
jgi:hypothetical protein